MRRGARGGIMRAFTLIEVVVAVGVLAIVTLVIAAVFDSVGETVSAGTRISNLNRRAAQLERVMRQDFRRIARNEGFLVIRNEYAQVTWDDELDNDEVALFPGENSPRLRRIDELMFFASGEFETAREPLHPDFIARAGEARIYYGHGQAFPAEGNFAADSELAARAARPMLDERNGGIDLSGARLGERPEADAGFTNPNEFASDWSLLRHVTLLVPEDELSGTLPPRVFHLQPGNEPGGGGDADPMDVARVRNHTRQVALQPAAHSIFGTLALLEPDLPSEIVGNGAPNQTGIRPAGVDSIRSGMTRVTDPLGAGYSEPDAPRLFTSGLVDIAVTSVEDIREVVESPYLIDTTVSNADPRVPLPLSRERFDGNPDTDDSEQGFAYSVDGLAGALPDFTFHTFRTLHDPAGPAAPTRSETPETSDDRADGIADDRGDQVQQQWMIESLPTIPFRPGALSGQSGSRMRYAQEPPRLIVGQRDGDEQRLLDAIESADQEMLRASVFLPGCSEFIVEWTYGVIDDDPDSPTFGQPIWYGLQRFEDADDDGTFDPPGERLIAAPSIEDDPFEDAGTPLLDEPGEFRVPSELLDPVDLLEEQFGSFPAIDRRLDDLCRVFPTGGDYFEPGEAPFQEWVFGQVDSAPRGGNPVSISGGTARSNNETKPWPWPTAIRVTLRLVDPEDETIEATHQATFRVRPRSGF